jgi:hypothetical protein
MMAALVATVLWLLVGHAVAGGLFWGLLQVPESNAWMLLLSVVLSALCIAVVGFVETDALLMWTGHQPISRRAARSVRNLPAAILGLLVFAAFWWFTAWVMGRTYVHHGEIDAALMARFGWTKTAWVHSTIAWIIWFVRYPIGVSLALSLAAGAAAQGYGAVVRFRWLIRGLAPLRLVLVTVWLLALIWLPWQAVYWRPRSLPSTWLEPVFVAAKLLVIYVVANVGWSLVLRTVARAATPATTAKPAP